MSQWLRALWQERVDGAGDAVELIRRGVELRVCLGSEATVEPVEIPLHRRYASARLELSLLEASGKPLLLGSRTIYPQDEQVIPWTLPSGVWTLPQRPASAF